MVKHGTKDEKNSISLVDSGCSNHMTGARDLFKGLDETHNQIVKLGDNKEMKVKALLHLRPRMEK